MTVGYGHGIAVTPLHLATRLCDLVQRRHLPPGDAAQGRQRTTRSAPARRVFSEDTSYKMRALLRLVVTKGTGKKADAPGYRVGGKTGTAEKYHNRSLKVTSFAGVFPMDEPRYRDGR